MSRIAIGVFVIALAVGVPCASAQGIDPSLTLGVDNFVYGMAVQQDGKVLIGGNFSTVGGTPRLNLARINVDGTLDAGFNPGTNGQVTALAVQPDGKILVAGYFTDIGGGTGTINIPRLARLNSDGTVDEAFSPTPNNYVRCVVLQPDGKILIAGGFSAVAGVSRAGLARLTTEGVADSFDPGVVGLVSMLALQTDGSVVVAGNYSQLAGATRTGLGRVNASGVLDAAFNPTVIGIVQTVAIQADNKILVGGAFSGLAGASRGNIGRLLSTGAIDPTFSPGAGNTVYTLAVYANGQIAVGGDFGSLAAQARAGIGFLNANGTPDSFNPGASGTVYGLLVQPDGRLLVQGNFTTLGNGATVPRQGLGRLFPGTRATQSLSYASGSNTITWLRGGPAPEVSAVEFATSADGVTFTTLGAGTRIAGGWQLTSAVVPAGPNQRLRARAWVLSPGNTTGSSYLVEALTAVSGTNLIENGDFSTGTTGWSEFGAPTMANLQSVVSGGVYEFYRVSNPGQAVILQPTGMPMHAFAAIAAQFQAGNSDSARKRLSVLVHDGNFSDLSVCTFWLPPNTPLQTYRMRTHTTQPWSNLTMSFYAASEGSSDGGAYRLDNVTATYDPTGQTDVTECEDPLAPAAPGGADSPSLLTNGDFSAGTAGWNIVFQMISQVVGGIFEFYRPAATPDPAGVILQSTGTAAGAGDIYTAQFDVGNSSSVRKRITVLLHDLSFSDLHACTFWLAPGQPLSTYTVRTYATRTWSNATLSIYAATPGDETWTRLDNAILRKTPGGATFGTNCVEPGGTLAPSGPPPAPAMSTITSVTSPSERLAGGSEISEGQAVSSTQLAIGPLDLPFESSTRVRFRLQPTGGRDAAIRIRGLGQDWQTVAVVPATDDWIWVEIDLTSWAEQIVWIQIDLMEDAPRDVKDPPR